MNTEHPSQQPQDALPAAIESTECGGAFNHDLMWSARSKVYHVPNCGWSEAIREGNRRFGSGAGAVRSGRRPCKVCEPPMPGLDPAEEGSS